MPLDQLGAIEIELIVVTDDAEHARDLISSLKSARYRYVVSELKARDSVVADFEATIESARGKRPVVVFLDCEFLNGQTEGFAARIFDLQRSMAIECVATRPPPETPRRIHLRRLGVHLFDTDQPAEIIPLH